MKPKSAVGAGSPSTKSVLATAFFVNILDMLTNFGVFLFTGSVTILAEMMQGLADFTATGFLIIGNWRSKKPAEALHPFGFGKETFFWSLLATIVMFGFASTFSIWQGINQITSGKHVQSVFLGLGVTFIGFFTNLYALSRSYKKIKLPDRNFYKSYIRCTKSAIKTSFVSDLIGTSSAFLGFISLLIFVVTGNIFYDALGAILIGIVLAAFSLLLLVEIKGYLIGRSAPAEVHEKITKVVESVPHVVDVVDLRTMYVGVSQLLVNIEVNLDDDLVTDQVERIMDDIREKVREEIPEVSHIQIEVESANVIVTEHEDITIKPRS